MTKINVIPLTFLTVSALSLGFVTQAQSSGGLDLLSYCKTKYGSSASIKLIQNNAYGFRCTNQNRDLTISVTEACTLQYGQGSTASFSDFNNPYSWTCSLSFPQRTVSYTSYGNVTEPKFLYESSKSVVLMPTPLNANEAQTALRYIDTCVDNYRMYSNRSFPISSSYNGKPGVAIVSNTCGAGCGYGGRAEIKMDEFADAINRVDTISSPTTWQVGFYELGRGGSSESNPLFPHYRAVDITKGHDVVASAFPEFVACECLRALGVSYENINDFYQTIGYPRNPGPAEYRRMFQRKNITFAQSQSQSQSDSNSELPRNWVMTSLFTHFRDRFGTGSTRTFFATLASIGQQRQVRSIVDVEKNLIRAARDAAGQAGVQYLVDEWRVVDHEGGTQPSRS